MDHRHKVGLKAGIFVDDTVELRQPQLKSLGFPGGSKRAAANAWRLE